LAAYLAEEERTGSGTRLDVWCKKVGIPVETDIEKDVAEEFDRQFDGVIVRLSALDTRSVYRTGATWRVGCRIFRRRKICESCEDDWLLLSAATNMQERLQFANSFAGTKSIRI